MESATVKTIIQRMEIIDVAGRYRVVVDAGDSESGDVPEIAILSGEASPVYLTQGQAAELAAALSQAVGLINEVGPR